MLFFCWNNLTPLPATSRVDKEDPRYLVYISTQGPLTPQHCFLRKEHWGVKTLQSFCWNCWNRGKVWLNSAYDSEFSIVCGRSRIQTPAVPITLIYWFSIFRYSLAIIATSSLAQVIILITCTLEVPNSTAALIAYCSNIFHAITVKWMLASVHDGCLPQNSEFINHCRLYHPET
jgi:hypothetical protein